VIYAGRLSREKGLHVLFKALAGGRFRLLIAGIGEVPRELRSHIPPRTYLARELTHAELRWLFPLADACVVPSVAPEAFPLVVGEAAAAGVLAVVARHSGLAEASALVGTRLPRESSDLLLVEPGDPQALRRALDRLARLPRSRRRVLGELTRAAAVAELSWAAIAKRVLSSILGY